MISTILARIKQGYRTITYPRTEARLPDRFRGLPVIKKQQCLNDCNACIDICPTGALSIGTDLSIDMGKCVFCTKCAAQCKQGAIYFSREHRIAARKRNGLIVSSDQWKPEPCRVDAISKLYGRSFKLRQVSAAGCNACEADINVLSTIAFDLGRFGIQIVASPRHADGIIVTGPVSENMRVGLLKTYEAVPDPRVVIACGTCAISGGLFSEHPEQHNGVDTLIPVDLYIPGCPPHPLTILDGLLKLLRKTTS